MWIWELRYFQANKDDILDRCKNKGDIRTSYFWGQGKGCKHTVMALSFASAVQSLSRAQERDCPYGDKPELHHSPPGLKVANTQQWHWDPLARYNLYQERKREITHTEANLIATAARLAYLLDRFHWRQIVCYSEIFNYSFHFRRLRTYLYGIRTEMVYTYTDTYYVSTGCFLNS